LLDCGLAKAIEKTADEDTVDLEIEKKPSIILSPAGNPFKPRNTGVYEQ